MLLYNVEKKKKNNKAYVKQISCTTAGVSVEKNFQLDRSAVSQGVRVHIVVETKDLLQVYSATLIVKRLAAYFPVDTYCFVSIMYTLSVLEGKYLQ